LLKEKLIDAYIITAISIGTALVLPKVIYYCLKKDGLLR